MTLIRLNRCYWSAYVLGVVTTLFVGLLWWALLSPPRVMAQIPDAGGQRAEMIAQLRAANQKLGEIAGVLHEMRAAQGTGESTPPKKKSTRIQP